MKQIISDLTIRLQNNLKKVVAVSDTGQRLSVMITKNDLEIN